MKRLVKNIMAGMGSIMVIAPTHQPPNFLDRATRPVSDAEAIAQDWAMVGNELRRSMSKVGDAQAAKANQTA